jgi:hypothetical protein
LTKSSSYCFFFPLHLLQLPSSELDDDSGDCGAVISTLVGRELPFSCLLTFHIKTTSKHMPQPHPLFLSPSLLLRSLIPDHLRAVFGLSQAQLGLAHTHTHTHAHAHAHTNTHTRTKTLVVSERDGTIVIFKYIQQSLSGLVVSTGWKRPTQNISQTSEYEVN